MSGEFILHPQIKADSAPVAELPLSDLRLVGDSRFPWLLLVPRRAGIAEIIDLSSSDRALLFDEIVAVSEALKTATGCYKLNIAAVGNVVRQLHIHAIARFETDAAWPRPVWGLADRVAYEAATRDRLIEKIRAALPA